MKFKYTDYHVHTRWSHDIKEFGPLFEDYIKVAEKNKINICFLDHYELYYVENDKNYPFYGDGKIDQYLEEIDKIKENYESVLSGLEVDYYIDREMELWEFMDEYEKQIDFIAGTLHEMDFGYPVTTREKLLKLLKKKKIKNIVDEYFELMERLINSKIFKKICHLDTIFRYLNPKDLNPTFDCDISDERVLNIGRLCIKNGIQIEYNLSGIKYPIARSFPSKKVVKKLNNEGAKIFVGSDSHSVNYFRTKIHKVKKAYKLLNKNK
ncbi:MAG: histidinol-phosphatase HisJ family protein [Candidatus Thorarchaeota archaeon]